MPNNLMDDLERSSSDENERSSSDENEHTPTMEDMLLEHSTDPIVVDRPEPVDDRDKPIVVEQEGIIVEYAKGYGIGIDTHRDFIAVSVLVKNGLYFYEYRQNFKTDWSSLVHSHEWAQAILTQCADPPIENVTSLHYCIESTSVYHWPIVRVWQGKPSIINPTLAGEKKRKTDTLDAKLLATQDLTSIWPESFVPSTEVLELRLLISERKYFRDSATKIGNRINTDIIRFGINLGRIGSVVNKAAVRSIVEDLASENPSKHSILGDNSIPDDIKPLVNGAYHLYDQFLEKEREYQDRIVAKVKSMQWETKDGTLPGGVMLDILTTAPGVGIITACLWLALIVTPNRFHNSKAVAAYCGLDPSLKVSAGKVTSTVRRGGNKQLHSALLQSGSRIVSAHSELFGKWGYQLYLKSGKWKKASNAVARKIAVALYYMQLTGMPFSYEKYNLLKETVVIDIPVEELPSLNKGFKRYIDILKRNGINTTSQLVTLYYRTELVGLKGLGRKFYQYLSDFIDNQRQYRKLYSQLHEEETK